LNKNPELSWRGGTSKGGKGKFSSQSTDTVLKKTTIPRHKGVGEKKNNEWPAKKKECVAGIADRFRGTVGGEKKGVKVVGV